MHDIYRTREPLELMAVEYSAQAPREAIEALLQLVEAAEQAAADEDWKEVATLEHRLPPAPRRADRQRADQQLLPASSTRSCGSRSPKVEHAPDFFRPFVSRNRAIAELLLAGKRRAAAAELKAYLAEAERMIGAGVSAA